MKANPLFPCSVVFLMAASAQSQSTGDVIGVHDLTTGSNSRYRYTRRLLPALSCASFRHWQCSPVESNPLRSDLHSVQQHNLRGDRQPPAAPRQAAAFA